MTSAITPYPASAAYPFEVVIAPPEAQSRITIFFRYLLFIPHMILIYCLQIAVQFITLVAWFAILFTGSYPVSMYKFSVDVLTWISRANAYLFLLTGVYPPFSLAEEPGYPIRVAVTPETEGRNRLTVFFRMLLAIPHFIVLVFLAIGVAFAVAIGWLVALFTGRVPGGIHEFIAGFTRWNTRLTAYMWLLTDKYPPFSLS